MMQRVAVALLIVAAAGWLVRRYLRRGAADTCCGEPECPVAGEMLRELERRQRGN